uniref:Uncharacterized protein n=1 Tax=Suricata suricatta TaxID=37032 RepID=A0A673UNJ7_SURSU
MMAQIPIPIVATISTLGIARNSRKRPASASHNSSGVTTPGGRKRVSASSFRQAKESDSQKKLGFSTVEEYSCIWRLPSDIVTGYLALRKATGLVS